MNAPEGNPCGAHRFRLPHAEVFALVDLLGPRGREGDPQGTFSLDSLVPTADASIFRAW